MKRRNVDAQGRRAKERDATALRMSLDEADAKRQAYRACCLRVWRELTAIEPELAAEIVALGFDEETAALWVCEPGRDGLTPAAKVVDGRGEDIQQMIRRTKHGFCA